MGNTEPPLASARAWIELLHAEVGYLLGQAGIPVLHNKGPTVARWLYPDGGRQWGDVDVLVPPSRMHDALAELAGDHRGSQRRRCRRRFGRRDWALPRRWAIALDDGSLVFRNADELDVD